MRRVILESPYASTSRWLPAIVGRWLNRRYARRCVRHSLSLGEAPIASHLLYTQLWILRDGVKDERARGIDAGLSWLAAAEAIVVYCDRGISTGMQYGIAIARNAGKPVEYRNLGGLPSGFAAGGDYRPSIMPVVLHASERIWPAHFESAVPDKGGRNAWPSQVRERPAPPAQFYAPYCNCVLERDRCNCMRDGFRINKRKEPAAPAPSPGFDK